MTYSAVRWSVALAALLTLIVLPGCKGTTQPPESGNPEALQAAQKLPDGTNVIAAMDQKDYVGAVSELSKIRESLAGPEQLKDLNTLEVYVPEKVAETSDSDEKAAEALRALSIIRRGR
jgi:hypothetical protein